MTRNRLDIVLESVTIEAVAAEGRALAHVVLPGDETFSRETGTPLRGRVVFVDYAVPGDVVDIRILKKKKNYLEGRVIRMVKPSGQRAEPFCSHFGVCGGCKWQHLPYPMQLEAKRQQVYDQLVRIGHLEVPEIRPTVPSERTERYRNKLEYSFSDRKWVPLGEFYPDAAPQPGAGFHVGKFFDKVLDIDVCHLQREPSNEIRKFVKRWCIDNGVPFYNLRDNVGVIRAVFVRDNEAGDVMLTVVFGSDFPQRDGLLAAMTEAFPQVKSLYYIINTKLNDSVSDQECILYHGDDAIYETMEGLRFKIGPKSFYQTNSLQAYRLYGVAREFAALTGTETVYDLYTGTGTIAQFVSSKAGKVIGIEYVPEAIEDARCNAEANGITNCTFFAGDMKDVLTPEFIAAHGRPDVMIVDPPRAGMHPDVVKTILGCAPARIVYVSCNPASQARDLAAMKDLYRIAAVQPVDMFPHTQHVENVCLLELI